MTSVRVAAVAALVSLGLGGCRETDPPSSAAAPAADAGKEVGSTQAAADRRPSSTVA